jgi:hypothetical protein
MATEENIRRLSRGTSGRAMEILLRGNPQEISAAGLVGSDADAAMTPEQIAVLEAAGLKAPGRPTTVQQLAMAIEAGLLPERTRIVHV